MRSPVRTHRRALLRARTHLWVVLALALLLPAAAALAQPTISLQIQNAAGDYVSDAALTLTEGDTLRFLAAANENTSVTATVRVEADAAAIAMGYVSRTYHPVFLSAGASFPEVRTTRGNSTPDPHGNITITLLPGTGYTVGTPSVINVRVQDDDTPTPVTFRDCTDCPEMVAIPGGSFLMGAPDSDDIASTHERPQHTVTIAPFSAGKHEVTFEEWDACRAAGGCTRNPADEGWGRDTRPVIHVDWNDAKQYVAWLTRKTGKAYRLLTEAEWEYVARAGSITRFWWGDEKGTDNANCSDCTLTNPPDPPSTLPVGSLPANAFGLHDTSGNVYEWVEDCYHSSYTGAPADGGAWVEASCTNRVVRGGAYFNTHVQARSTERLSLAPSDRDRNVGFRVARSSAGTPVADAAPATLPTVHLLTQNAEGTYTAVTDLAATEGDAVRYRAASDADTSVTVTVRVDADAPAVAMGYASVPAEALVFSGGTQSTHAWRTADGNHAHELPGTLTLTLLPGDGYTVGSPSVVTIAVANDDNPYSFQDCAACPEMVDIPAGTFTMGTPSSERFEGFERPRHTVTISSFAIGRYEVTFDEWDACHAAGGCTTNPPEDVSAFDGVGFGRGNLPVVNITWSDMQQYAAWLSATTGETYRLPTEAEWEYAARAGSTTAYHWGNDAGRDNANCIDCFPEGIGEEDEYQPLAVGSFDPNAFGVYDMSGNVWEFVEDCWHANYWGAPTDGSAWREEHNGDCTLRVLRSGGFLNTNANVRSGMRLSPSATKGRDTGFRVAKEITPPEGGDTFEDCRGCPEMVDIPGGTFEMGSPDTEEGRDSNEGPQRTVTIAPFAIGKYEVTFAEWEWCRTDGGCTADPDDESWGSEHHLIGTFPVVNISWDAAQEYVTWLSEKTGEDYRLLTEAEWEYAARAGTQTPFPWGDEAGSGNANCSDCGNDEWDGDQAAPVGTFPANPFGLHDMAGNVKEWVEDCRHENYTNAPTDGTAWTDADAGLCGNRGARGGSWDDDPESTRPADRSWSGQTRGTDLVGFRVARAAHAIPTPTVHLLTQDASGNYVTSTDLVLIEGGTLRFRAVSDRNADVTVTVRIDADANAVAMGYASNAGQELALFGRQSPPHSQTVTGNTTAEPDGTITLTLLPGAGYEVGAPSVFTVTIQDNDTPFQDCADCPELVTISGGTFTMGAPDGEFESSGDERPQHPVTIASFAVGKYEVTFDEWTACVSGGGCTTTPNPADQGWGRGNQPVINVSWDDAKEYVAWLSQETGEDYRLLTEAEWEYAARAGTQTTYYWGDDVGSGHAHCLHCSSGFSNSQTVPVGSFAPNAFGLHDMAGNVGEWVEDCWHTSYTDAPTDGSAWESENGGNCSSRVLRGGHRSSTRYTIRHAERSSAPTTLRNFNFGFRVARSSAVPPPPPPLTVHLQAPDAEGDYVTSTDLTITEGDPLRFRAASSENTSVTVTVRVSANAAAVAMGYASNAGRELAFSGGVETPPHSQTATGNDTVDSPAAVTLTLLPGDGYEVGAPSVLTVTIMDDEFPGFRDCDACPQMVSMPAGTFTMGSPSTEAGSNSNERPQHTVTIAPFAIGRYEVTFAEWDACHAAGGCTSNPGDNTWGRGTRPVINITWSDAQQYVTWLTQKTGQTYRLLTEAEWEYAARAGTQTAYYWGNNVGSGNANCNGCGGALDDDATRQTAPVGSYPANPFGLHDMAGNVNEWVEDCRHDNYTNAPIDGRAWKDEDGGNCNRWVIRGGSYAFTSDGLRSANRGFDYLGTPGGGFRVARASATPPLPPTVHLQMQDAQGNYTMSTEFVFTEGDPLRFRAESDANTGVTVTVRVNANADAVAMGYASNAAQPLTFSGSTSTAPVGQTPANNSAADAPGTITLTLLPGAGYEVGEPSFIHVTILDDDDGLPPTFRDCADCPEIVTIMGGTFLMGSPAASALYPSETPQHTVTVPDFAAGRYEVTFEEWDACRTAGGCTHNPEDAGFGRDTRPVINVSWNDAQDYVAWLSRETGENYRLLTEAEWEYASRAGSTTVYPWGDQVGTGNANCAFCGGDFDDATNRRTAPVGSYPANPFGLYDMVGNVKEWVEDCWHDDYTNAPTDGRAWEDDNEGGCTQRVRRDGSYADASHLVYPAARGQDIPTQRRSSNGFRVARTSAVPPLLTVHLLTQDAQGDYAANSELLLTEGDALGFRAVSNLNASVTVTVRIDADATARGMGYASNTAGLPLAFSDGMETPPHSQTAAGNSASELSGTITLTLLPGTGYEVAAPSVVTVTVLDDDGGRLPTFQDCDDCPEVVVLPGGTFEMGSPADETTQWDVDYGPFDAERPRHTVAIVPFAAGKYEVTFAEWDACRADGGCTHNPGDAGWGRGNRPVMNVSWEDAQEYVAWLSEETGQTYRLLTDAEWEYAARAGTQTAYWWGDDRGTGNANCAGCGGEWDDQDRTAPVGSFDANAFGLHDMAGNVSEWVEDCYHSDYTGAPTDGSAWVSESCDRVVRRNAHFDSHYAYVRSAARFSRTRTSRASGNGFRVARASVAPPPPTVHLLTPDAGGDYAANSDTFITEGDALRFRAGSDLNTGVTVTVRIDADANARAMGYASNAGRPLTFSDGVETPPHSQTAAGNSTVEPRGTVTLTLLPGDGYEVGEPSVVTVSIQDDDNDSLVTFRDCDDCPEMVPIPGDTFTMGSPADTALYPNEIPQHTVTIPDFAAGRHEVTFAEWEACRTAGGCTHNPNDSGWGRGNRPVIDVSWDDAQEYVAWLSEKTGQTYRLLTEAEWEYAARAGSTTRYYWGDTAADGDANCAGCGGDFDDSSNRRTAPVGTYPTNAFGLYDMAGNIAEWVQDCWHNDYTNAPTDGSAWGEENNGDCTRRVLRDGSYGDAFYLVYPAIRSDDPPTQRRATLGFRVARSSPVPPTPVVRLLTPDANGNYAARGGLLLTEGDALRFRAAASAPTNVTVRVRVEADATARAMGYASNATGQPLAFSNSRETSPHSLTAAGNTTDETYGTITLTLLPGDGYEVAAPSVLTVTVLDDDGDPVVFRDCDDCPQMVPVPAGAFTMGSPGGETGRYANEGPQRTVTIATPFAVGRYEVTLDEWDACRAAGGCSHNPNDGGWGRGDRPVINVTWDDAQQYVAWLSRETGQTYRLLSEAEWEYAARAGTQTAYHWGDEIGSGNANCNGCGGDWEHVGTRTAPVGSYDANAFGLYDMLGNVGEWTEDCWHSNYTDAPTDGSAWTRENDGNCSQRVTRDGNWSNEPGFVRSAFRLTRATTARTNARGFRVARASAVPPTPVVHLLIEDGADNFVADAALLISEGDTLRFRAAAGHSANVTVTVRLDADATARAMGYRPGTYNPAFAGATETPAQSRPAFGNARDESYGVVTLTLLPGAGYEVGAPDILTVTVLDDDGDPTASRDCTGCPEMVTIPGGAFTMGSPSAETGRGPEESPQRTVTVAPFAVARNEVTFAEWDACRAEGECLHNPNDQGWTPRANRPVVDVSWDDAQQYVAWLTQKTGTEYRLLSEAEWEYAARAGSTTAYHWGNAAGTDNANCDGCGGVADDADRSVPVGGYDANAFGLNDMLGNVWEWVEDCWHDDYTNAPTDGSAWEDANDGICEERLLRGGSWYDDADYARSGARSSYETGDRYNHIGFRVARTAPVSPLPVVQLRTQNARGQYVAESDLTLNEGVPLRFRAIADKSAGVTVTVRVNADADAVSMGYASNAGEALAFADNRETPAAEQAPTNNTTDEALGTVTLTLLPGAGYRVGELSVVTVEILDDDGEHLMFRDCDDCPAMVSIPGGAFTMGSPTAQGGPDDERPEHTVTIAPFAVGRFEVTFDEWEACRTAGACTHDPADGGWGKGTRPVINVNWNDAQEYVSWLSRETGENYRLLTEAEWEYAARAGSTTRYHWGDLVESNNANCNGCDSLWDNSSTAPVARFLANDFGLHDMLGNAEEWVEDCWHNSYEGAPTDGSAWTSDCGTTQTHATRGGSWGASAQFVSTASRSSNDPTLRRNHVGFRVARSVSTPVEVSALVEPPTLDLRTEDAQDSLRISALTATEGDILRFRVYLKEGEQFVAVTFTVRTQADATARNMGYESGTYAGTDPSITHDPQGGNDMDEAPGSLTVTLLPGLGYQVGEPSVVNVTILDDDGDPLTFRDCAECPAMVGVPSGTFTMGSPDGEGSRGSDEGPQHAVTISAFAVGRNEVTFAEWDACVADGGCQRDGTGYTPNDRGWGRGNLPVVHVTWNDAQQYVQWLTRKAGTPYRLLSEAEWEYAARAGSTTAYPWGNDIGTDNARCAECGNTNPDWDNQPAPVGSFAANAFGLHDMAGNVREWVEDCYHDSYADTDGNVIAPTDGTAWGSAADADCDRPLLRGGMWDGDARHLRSADRTSRRADRQEHDTVGFRVARTSLLPLATSLGVGPTVHLRPANAVGVFAAVDAVTLNEGDPLQIKAGADEHTSVTVTVRVEADTVAQSMGYASETSTPVFSNAPESLVVSRAAIGNEMDEPPGTITLTLLPGYGYEVGEPSVVTVTILDDDGNPLIFRDCDDCPQMVTVPAGTFQMGSPDGEGEADERPQRTVTIAAPFAVGRYEVTFAEWDACVADSGCTTTPSPSDWGRGTRPVMNIDWDDAKEYVAWLTQETGQSYRLLTEAEWEYAARASSTTAYYWGNGVGTNNANCDGCGSEWDDDRTAPVGSFAPNAFGLHDMFGNVWEWTEDCHHGNYTGAPTDGSAWGAEDSGDCDQHMARGGSWTNGPELLRSAYRIGASDPSRLVGFRVARTAALPASTTTSPLIKPTIHLRPQNAAGEYVRESAVLITESALWQVRAGSDEFTSVSVTVRADADTNAIAMGYSSGTRTLTFEGSRESLQVGEASAGNSTTEPPGTITLTLLPGFGYEVGEDSVVTVHIIDDDGGDPVALRDCDDCPEMVVVPASTFTMGSPDSETGRDNDESPQHTVTIATPFAIGRYEVTFHQWDECRADGGCSRDPHDQGFGRGARPVLDLNPADAREYARWLSEKTGETYRLPSEAEWEYVARAGRRDAYHWGGDVGSGNANCSGCGGDFDDAENRRTAPVGSYAPNRFGLYDTAGNVFEWVEDCWHDSYTNAPVDGSAWGSENGGECHLGIFRGGGFVNGTDHVRSADRNQTNTGLRVVNSVGFRLVRESPVPPPTAPGQPTVHFTDGETHNAFAAVSDFILNEGDARQVRVASDRYTSVTVTVRVDADASAVSMGYASTAGPVDRELAFTGSRETSEIALTTDGNDMADLYGIVTLTLLPGEGYQVGERSVVTLTFLNDDGAPLIFRDCADHCPQMVTIPGGTFEMGSSDTTKTTEIPQHTVTVAPFAAGRYEVTFDEWDACVADGGCATRVPADGGWGRGSLPATDIHYADALLYVQWLSRKTGETYRLLTEAEWEYAARAGTTTAYPWGDDVEGDNSGNAHCTGCGSSLPTTQPAPVGSFAPNDFGLHDTAGNVAEWTQDCWHNDYTDAPTDGRAWGEENSGSCNFRILRGGAYASAPADARSAYRIGGSDSDSTTHLDRGFRVARASAVPAPTSALVKPTLHLRPQNAAGEYGPVEAVLLTEGATYRFRVGSDEDTSVVATVRADHNSAAVAMGYAQPSGPFTLTFDHNRETGHIWRNSHGNNTAETLAGTVILTLLPGFNYEVGEPSTVTITFVDDDGNPFGFRDCEECPEMVSIPAGTFTMGSPDTESGRGIDEGAQRTVTVAAFAVGRYEVTNDEWAACHAAHDAGETGCTKGGVPGDRPAANLNWNDVQEYVTWLTQKTGQTYRLLSEAEWEYAARAGSTTRYPWGADIGTGNAHCVSCTSTQAAGKTAPVGSFPANDFGLHDMIGNVWEWVEDCPHGNYNGAPVDGSVWSGGDCSKRVLRGAGYGNDDDDVRTANRFGYGAANFGPDIGFRVARESPIPALPEVHLLTQNGRGDYVAVSAATIAEGTNVRWRAGTFQNAEVTVTVGVEIGAVAAGMGYRDPDNEEIDFSGGRETNNGWIWPRGGNDRADPPGTVRLTLLPGAGYRVGEPSGSTVTILDDDGDTLSFRDCEGCPEMVALTGGTFTMGENSSLQTDERPEHTVTIGPFMIGRYEVTFDEWEACRTAGGCSHNPGDDGWGKGNRPVINVNWNDAQEYVTWLSESTGTTYRLLTEAEWEYAARAGSTTEYPWGDNHEDAIGNCDGCDGEWDARDRTAPVGSYDANAFGLHDLMGNVWEWVEDCSHSNYDNAPTDGSAWLSEDGGNCSTRRVRGGSWDDDATRMRSAFRAGGAIASRHNAQGFRVARSNAAPVAGTIIDGPTVHLETQSSGGLYVREGDIFLREGATLRFRAVADEVTGVTVTVRVEADALAEAMGYESNEGRELVFNGEQTPAEQAPEGGNDTEGRHGTLRLTLLPGDGYRVGEPSSTTVTILDILDDNDEIATFRDCDDCPEMMVVPGGAFTMGSPDDETGRDSDEEPQHTRTISPFAAGLHEVTFAEWDACRTAGGCSHNPGDSNWGRGNQPVINVSWDDAQQYATWLSQKTGETYRLLSEAEWEYAARAGSATVYPWGDDIGSGDANCNDCGGDWEHRGTRTAPVGTFPPNNFGLRDMLGNASEWVQDCAFPNYNGAPTDGRAWEDNPGICGFRRYRGGAYSSTAAFLRTANRAGRSKSDRVGTIGFRVARDLTASQFEASNATPDVNRDGAVNANDALILYYVYSLRSSIGEGR